MPTLNRRRMQINSVKRPWQSSHSHGNRYNPDPFYQSVTWKNIKRAFKNSKTRTPDGKEVSNKLCYDCFIEGRIVLMHTVDHMTRINDGGSKTDYNNLRSLCAHHHAIKSANEGNELKKAKTNNK
jgi:hypothetical protein